MNEQQQFDFLDIITILSFLMQLLNQHNITKQVTNGDVMRELKNQDSKYLQVIIDQNNKIISLLETFLDHSAQNT